MRCRRQFALQSKLFWHWLSSMSWQSKSASPGLGFEILENMHSTSNQARFGRLASFMLPCKSIQVCATSSCGKFPQWNFVVISPKNICSLSDDSILRPGAGGWCQSTVVQGSKLTKYAAWCSRRRKEGCPSKSRSASRPCGLQSFTENVLHHLASVATSNQSKCLAFVMPVWFELQTFRSDKH